jgi:acetyl-CoA carboxylase biotin carboxylase subunit
MNETFELRPIRKVLIANRGEIAVRIARACREMGIATVAVASDADATALHTRVADEVVLIGAAPAAESYLRGERIIEVARATGCDAIHPAYGFLSQNAAFAEAVEAAGIAFVGPPPSAMRLMGDKGAARASMIAAGVPVVPGYQGTGHEDLATLVAEARKVGFPLLVKALAGGGGKGMRLVEGGGADPDAELAEAIESARREAVKSFGDGRLFIERYVQSAHHVEVQILADAHGTVLHLCERECSIQRRYQKIIEESPSPLLDAALREQVCSTAVAAARACGYVNAGTVEMLVSAADRSFFFLEMNTRLQVEHPVTELVTGIDIVKAQLRVAMGEPLWFAQSDVAQRGHAMEARLYAEDPENGFAPSTGTAALVHLPTGPGVRVDSGLESGDAVSVYYDPMVAKVLVYADDRAGAIARLDAALRDTVVLGIRTNVEFLRSVLAEDAFVRGAATTAFVESEMADWAPAPAGDLNDELIAAAVVEWLEARDARGGGGGGGAGADGAGDVFSPWARADGFRIGG